jgi:hypothetical protein
LLSQIIARLSRRGILICSLLSRLVFDLSSYQAKVGLQDISTICGPIPPPVRGGQYLSVDPLQNLQEEFHQTKGLEVREN